MSFYEVQIRYGFPENLVIDTNLAGALWWLEQLSETVGEDQEVGFWKNVEVPGSGVAKILSEAGDQRGHKTIHHRGVDPECRITAEEAARLVKGRPGCSVEVFET